jgi:hypothetical protein
MIYIYIYIHPKLNPDTCSIHVVDIYTPEARSKHLQPLDPPQSCLNAAANQKLHVWHIHKTNHTYMQTFAAPGPLQHSLAAATSASPHNTLRTHTKHIYLQTLDPCSIVLLLPPVHLHTTHYARTQNTIHHTGTCKPWTPAALSCFCHQSISTTFVTPSSLNHCANPRPTYHVGLLPSFLTCMHACMSTYVYIFPSLTNHVGFVATFFLFQCMCVCE